MFRIIKLAGSSAILLLAACATSGPTFEESGLGSAPIPDGKARIVFLRTRDSGLYLARQASVSLDGEKIGGAHMIELRRIDALKLRINILEEKSND